jgi:hypothetical protein
VSEPETVIVLGPVFLMVALIRGAPLGVRLARGVEIVYLGAAVPPTDRYMRMPTRLTSLTGVSPGALTDAHTTEYRSPREAFAGMRTCTATIVAMPGPSRSRLRLTRVQRESSLVVRPAANENDPARMLAPAA